MNNNFDELMEYELYKKDFTIKIFYKKKHGYYADIVLEKGDISKFIHNTPFFNMVCKAKEKAKEYIDSYKIK